MSIMYTTIRRFIPPTNPLRSAPVRGNVTTANSGGASVASLAITKPTGGSVGDLYLIYGFIDVGTSGNALTGWTQVINGNGTSCHVSVWYKVVDGTEGASETISFASSAEIAAYYMHISNIDSVTPIGTVGSVGASGATPIVIPGITTTATTSLVYAFITTSNAQSTYGLSSGAGWSLAGGTLKSGTASTDIAGTYLINNSTSVQTLSTASVTYSGGAFGSSFAELEINGALV